jgi:TonB family protein
VPGYEPPQVIERFEPAYPERARRQNKGGSVVLKVLVSEEGRVVRVVVEAGEPDAEFEAAAIDAVLRWRYRPAQEHGHAIRGWTSETFDFEP